MSCAASASNPGDPAAPDSAGGDGDTSWHIEIASEMDRHRTEALFLEIRRLAARHAGAVKTVRITRT
jgi:hypothetical protein